MQRLWSWDRPVLVRDVVEDLQRDRQIAYTTVMTVLDNLYRKGYVTRHKEGRAYRYTATWSREQHTARLMEQALAESSDRSAALLHFVEQMPAAELARLRKALASFDSEPQTKKAKRK